LKTLRNYTANNFKKTISGPTGSIDLFVLTLKRISSNTVFGEAVFKTETGLPGDAEKPANLSPVYKHSKIRFFP
jgi:hypothetical protein